MSQAPNGWEFAPGCKPVCTRNWRKESNLLLRRLGTGSPMKSTRRGNYESGSDYVLEYGELRFTFNERDFTERVEQAAIKLDFVPGPLAEEEREDLVNLAVNGEVIEPSSTLGEHINRCWAPLVGASARSLSPLLAAVAC